MAAVYKIGSKWRADWIDNRGVRHRLRFETEKAAQAYINSIASRTFRSLLNQNERDRDQANNRDQDESAMSQLDKNSLSQDDDEASPFVSFQGTGVAELNDDKPMSSDDKAVLLPAKAVPLSSKSALPSNKSVFGDIRHRQKRAFLWGFAQTGSINESAKIADIHRDSHYIWLKKDETYAEAFKLATIMAGNVFEDEVYRRAFSGDERSVFHKGKKVGSYKIYSDLLAIFALKGIFPEKYRDNQPGVSFQGPTQINITIKNESSLPSPQDFISCSEEKETKD